MAVTVDEFSEMWANWSESVIGTLVKGASIEHVLLEVEMHDSFNTMLCEVTLDVRHPDNSEEQASGHFTYQGLLDLISGEADIESVTWTLTSEQEPF